MKKIITILLFAGFCLTLTAQEEPSGLNTIRQDIKLLDLKLETRLGRMERKIDSLEAELNKNAAASDNLYTLNILIAALLLLSLILTTVLFISGRSSGIDKTKSRKIRGPAKKIKEDELKDKLSNVVDTLVEDDHRRKRR